MAKDACCCFHIITGAALVGVLQLVAVVFLLSTTSVLLDRWHEWKSDFERELQYKPVDTTTPNGFNQQQQQQQQEPSSTPFVTNSGLEAFVEIHLAHHVAFYALWIIFLFVLGLAFKSHRPVLVLPNLVMQVISLPLTLILAGTLIARLALLYRQYRSASEVVQEDIAMRYSFYGVLLGILVFLLVMEIAFISVHVKYYRYLRERHLSVFPNMPVLSFPYPVTLGETDDRQKFTVTDVANA